MCFGAQCADAQFPNSCCAANSNGAAFTCSRVNSYYYQVRLCSFVFPGRAAS